MLHKFFEKGDWFAPKRFGYGAGLPIAWQGWVVLLAFAGAIVGLALMRELDPFLRFGGMAAAIVTLVTISKKRTRGGWRWRWGEWE
ncbi:hypothetical protein [Tsuneonella mangrovi]|uniref:hypothetical protein n=1 Tax=Tsuneonella mangrovi TaxID=1982042 RepID=UPI000BA25417|nr:hypothetical protein [Tsuneonella mangrovi]